MSSGHRSCLSIQLARILGICIDDDVITKLECNLKLMKIFTTAAVAAVMCSAGIAHAGLLQFTTTGADAVSFQIDSNAMPSVSGGVFSYLANATIPGSHDTTAEVFFSNEGYGGGFQFFDTESSFALLAIGGPQLYSDPEGKPTFMLGNFSFDSGVSVSITDLTPAPASVPEPASIAMILGGLGLLAMMRKRTQAK